MKERQLELAEKKLRLGYDLAADVEELDPGHSQRQCLEDAITKQLHLLKECVCDSCVCDTGEKECAKGISCVVRKTAA